MEAYLEEALTPFEDGTMPDAPLPQEIDKHFFYHHRWSEKGEVVWIVDDSVYDISSGHDSTSARFVSLGQSIYASREESRESREEARAATQRAIEVEERAVEARQECEELRSHVSSLEELIRILLGGMPRGSHNSHSLHGRGSSQAGRGSPQKTRSSQGRREGSRASPTGRGSPVERGSAAVRSAHIRRLFQGRAPSHHIDVHLSRGAGDEDEYDDDETQP